MYDVIIAGGGPVGLFLACELGRAGCSVLVLEKMGDPHSPLKAGWMGMRGLNSSSTEAIYRRGLLDDVRRTALAWMAPDKPGMEIQSEPNQPPVPRFAGHFAGIPLFADKIDFSGQKYIVAGPSATGGMISLEGIEELLANHAQKLGVEIKRGLAVTGFTQNSNSVTVQAEDESFQSQWLAGCDGGHSTVRKIAGFDFAGTDPEFTGYTAWVDIADPEKLRPGFNLTETGMYNVMPGGGRIGMVDFDGGVFDRNQDIPLEFLQEKLRHISGTDVTLTALHVASTYTDRARQATTYRKDRVLLAGDAAHIHSPLGGQGLNTGIADAMNLGWKLAATIQGWAPDGLLDTYTTERHPAGAWTLEWTRAQVAIMKPNPHARAIAKIIYDLIGTREGTTYFAEKISGISLRYNLPGDHPLIGRSAPDFEFEDGTRLGDYLHDGSGLLVDLACNEELGALSQRWSGRVKYHSGKAKDSKGLSMLLVRPDGFVAWAEDAMQDTRVVEDTMQHWFGSTI